MFVSALPFRLQRLRLPIKFKIYILGSSKDKEYIYPFMYKNDAIFYVIHINPMERYKNGYKYIFQRISKGKCVRNYRYFYFCCVFKQKHIDYIFQKCFFGICIPIYKSLSIIFLLFAALFVNNTSNFLSNIELF